MPTVRLHALALLALAAVAAAAPPPAAAGTYTVHTCSTPGGAPAGMGGWTSSASPAIVGRDGGSATACQPGGSLSLQFGATGLPVASGSWVAWDFSAPPGTAIASVSFARAFNLGWPVVAGVANRPYAYDAWHDEDENAGMLDFQAPQSGKTLTDPSPVPLDAEADGWESLHIGLRCFGLVGSLNCGTFPAQVVIPRATIGMTDADAPTTDLVGGSLAGDDPVRGAGDLLFHASDDGAGVYRSIVAVDGGEVARGVIDGDGGRCADVDPGDADDYEFSAPRPCPLDASGEVQLDTASLHDGAHVVRVSVEDAAGNVDVVGERTVTTHNAPIATRAPALGGTARVGTQLSVDDGGWDGAPTAFDARWLRCDADGTDCAGIAGASGSTYTLAPADAYRRVVAEVTAANASGAASAQSAPSGPVADADGRTAPPAGGGPAGGAGGTGGGATGGGGGPGGGGAQPGGGGQPGGSGGGGGAGGSGAGGAGAQPGAPGAAAGLANPLATTGGHVANGTSPAGRPRLTLAFRLASGATTTRVRSPRGRRWTLAGRLLDGAGHGIGGARLAVAEQVAGRRWTAHGAVRTGADGRFAFALPPGPSRALKVAYYPFSDSRTFTASNVATEDALAPMTIGAAPRRVAAGGAVRLSGRVGGEALPRGGLLVTLQGWQAGWGWRTFRTVRTTRAGAWSTRYRFRLPHGRFAFRALVPRQGAFPFASSRSPAVTVTVG
jgi:hypothetical protein